jgi:hypothetical protein
VRICLLSHHTLHLIINDHGELLAVVLTPGNTDDRKPVPDMTKGLVGKLFGDQGIFRRLSLSRFLSVAWS